MVDIKKAPFYLTKEKVKWVEETYENMTFEERIGQLFCPIVFSSDPEELSRFAKKYNMGGVLYREGKAEEIRENHKVLQENSKIPLLTAANLEFGGVGSAIEGTYYGREMLVAATGNVDRAYQLGKVSCSEGAAVGVNWSLAPVVDIDINFRNPITNVKTFGNDVERIKKMALRYCEAAQEEGVAVSIKHFPGDGVDERDQHLLTSVNDLSVDEWFSTFGKIYKHLIEHDVLTVMAGHIAFPEYEEKCDGKPCKEIIPASLSKNILTGLLREELGFNGMITSDATPMVGFSAAMERRLAVPMSIANGCDMFLFNKNLDEDIYYMKEGYKNGILTEERLKDAVYRILATKAAINLEEKMIDHVIVPDKSALDILRCEEYDRWARECADEGVTLVKDTQKLLPISPIKHKRVLFQMMGDFPSNERVYEEFNALLTREGFEVIKYIPEDFSKPLDSVEEFRRKYDLVMYCGNIETASNKTVSRINWYTFFGHGNNMPWFVKEVPTLFVSVGNPYHLLDAPMIKTYINGYCNSSYVIEAVIEKILGRSKFKGISPVDPFCGRQDTKM